MPRKGMKSLCFSHTKTTSSASLSLSPAADQIMESAAALILKWDPDSSQYARVTSLFYESRSEAHALMKSVSDLQRLMHFLVSESPSSEALIAAQTLMQIAMKRLQKEFYQILSTNRAYLHPESVSTRSSRASARSSTSDNFDELDDLSEADLLSSSAMDDLRSIAECMISAGYAKECIAIYNVIRKSIVDEGIYRLGVEKFSQSSNNNSNNKSLPWPVIELRVKIWLRALKISLQTLFNGERILCDHVFSSSVSVRESCFSHITKDGALLLFSFPEAFASKASKKTSKSKSSSSSSWPTEKVFRALDMYSAIYERWDEIESLFSFDSTRTVRDQAYSSLVKIAEFVRSDLSEFESSVQKDNSKTVPRGGGLHPLTLRAANHLSLLADYPNALSDILRDSPPPPRQLRPLLIDSIYDDEANELDYTVSESSDSNESSARIAWLVLVLICKLDTKAKRYDDVSVSYLFLANNLQHIVRIARESNLRYLVGEDWCDRHDRKVRQFAANYERLAWGKPICALPVGPLDSNEVLSPEEAKTVLRSFNSGFEEALKKQRNSVVKDSKLRDHIVQSLTNNLVSLYAQFYHNNAHNLPSRPKYTPDDVHNLISEIFHQNSDDDEINMMSNNNTVTTMTSMTSCSTPYSSSASSSPASSSSSSARRRNLWRLI